MVKDLVEEKPKLQKYLFDKGFLITDNNTIDVSEFPFYCNWKVNYVGKYCFYIHKSAKFYTYDDNGKLYFLIGHAYNPFTMEINEENILRNIAEQSENDSRADYIDELTGVFILGMVENGNISVELDCSGMQYGCYGEVNGHIYVTSHMRLPGDILGLETDEFVNELTHYRWYRYMLGNYLPGNLTCYKEFKRIIPNTRVTYSENKFSIERFYPKHEISMCETEAEYNCVIEEGARIMRNNMECISQKWNRPAISLTGGIDSNTTFAAANGIYDKFTTFSYVSMFRESVDAEAAKNISIAFNVPHKVYEVPQNNDEVENFEVFKAIFEHNDGDIGLAKEDDTRKKITLINSDVCDVEVKSWVSETIRAYAYKYFGRTKFPKSLKPRDYSSLYKIFLGKRSLCRKTDKYFAEYIKETDLKANLFNYDETDFFIWEMEHGGKCGLNIGVMKSCFDITIPYNNRKLLDLLLRVPLEKRISDQHHMDMKKLLNKKLFDMNIRVVNLNETKKRKKAINAYYIVNTHITF